MANPLDDFLDRLVTLANAAPAQPSTPQNEAAASRAASSIASRTGPA
jgi:hypothetical protein